MNTPTSFVSHEQAIAWAHKVSARLKPSRPWQPLKPAGRMPVDGAEEWMNNLFHVTLRSYEKGWHFNASSPWKQIGISSLDGEPRHDWREFQKIKNQLCGDEWEAIELYPAESRLVDPSNYYILYCAPNISIGKFIGRTLRNETTCVAPQRAWAKGEQPPDCQ